MIQLGKKVRLSRFCGIVANQTKRIATANRRQSTRTNSLQLASIRVFRGSLTMRWCGRDQRETGPTTGTAPQGGMSQNE